MKKPKPAPPPPPTKTPEEVEASRAIVREAARICLVPTLPLIGMDDPVSGRVAEQEAVDGMRARFQFVEVALYIGAPSADVEWLVTAQGGYGADRMAAVWWLGANIIGGSARRVDRGELPAREWIRLWDRDIPDLLADGWMSSGRQVLERLRGAPSPRDYLRERGRSDMARDIARMRALAEGRTVVERVPLGALPEEA